MSKCVLIAINRQKSALPNGKYVVFVERITRILTHMHVPGARIVRSLYVRRIGITGQHELKHGQEKQEHGY